MGCNSTKMQVHSVTDLTKTGARASTPGRYPNRQNSNNSKLKGFRCLLGCDVTTMASTVKTDNSQVVGRDYSHEPMFAIFSKYDKDKDGYLKKGDVTEALAEAGILVVDEDLAFEWLDRNFDNKLGYKEFRRASEKAPKLCPVCNYERPDSSESEDA